MNPEFQKHFRELEKAVEAAIKHKRATAVCQAECRKAAEHLSWILEQGVMPYRNEGSLVFLQILYTMLNFEVEDLAKLAVHRCYAPLWMFGSHPRTPLMTDVLQDNALDACNDIYVACLEFAEGTARPACKGPTLVFQDGAPVDH